MRVRTYDLVMTHALDSDDFFIHRVQEHCAARGLNFFLADPHWVQLLHDKIAAGEVTVRALLNMHSEHHLPDDPFHRLVRLAHERGAAVIDPPELAAAGFDKANLHPKLAKAGLKAPATVIVPREQVGTFQLSESDRAALGAPFVIKPSMGYGKKGLVLDAQDERDIERSASAWASPAYLLQKKITPRFIQDAPAYFRLYYVFGAIWICWWNCFNDRYRLATRSDLEEFGLSRLQEIPSILAGITHMNFFSTEVAQSDAGEFILIDYVNDQCHMLTQSSNPRTGVPDEVVAGIARRLVEGAQQLIRARGTA
ncbi:MAG TPA: hypothetical protein VEH27_18515 [Methylomirabilota bacterium]|nr:hypothetical protein [Methylomirabilota bacterium]